MISSTQIQALLASLEPVENLPEFKRLAKVVDTHGMQLVQVMQGQEPAHDSHVAKLERPATLVSEILDKFDTFYLGHNDISDEYVSTEIFWFAWTSLSVKQWKFCRIGMGCDRVPLAGEWCLEKSANVRVIIKYKDTHI